MKTESPKGIAPWFFSADRQGSNPSSDPFLITVILLFFLFLAGRTDCQRDPDPYKECAPYPFRCGNMTQITYPFLAGDRPPFCGFKDMVLTCENDSPKIEIGEEDYFVRNVTYPDRLLTIVDRDIWRSDCPLPFKTTTLSNAFGVTAPREVLSIYYNCSSDLMAANEDLYEIPCLGRGTTGDYHYFSTEPKNQIVATNYCRQAVEVNVLEGARDRLRKNQSSYIEVMKEGFEVKWLISAGWCTECFRSGGICGSNSSVAEETVCFCPDGTRYSSCSAGYEGRSSVKMILGISIGVGGSFLLAAVSLFMIKKKGFCCTYTRYTYQERIFFWRNSPSVWRNVEVFLEKYGSLSPKRYTYSDIKRITTSFKHKLGQGGFGGVYKGKLDDGSLVAVKLLSETKGNGEEFMNEVASIGQTSHVNIVTLMGFCSEGSRRALVYEFMPNGSLEKFIYTDFKAQKSRHLGWEKLYQIAVGIAKGLEYLHRGCSTRILHFDIKPHNILLDKDFCPKISDFGMAKLCPTRDSIISMLGTRGTVGYIAPEVFSRNFGGVSHKSDVYSYGMMVLEMVGGRRNINAEVDNSSEIYFPDWIYKRLDHPSLGLLFDQEFTTEEEQVKVRKMILVGIWCIQTNSANRPSMSRVLEMLEGSLEAIQVPPKPYLSSPPRSPDHLSSSTTSTQHLGAED